MSVMTAERAKQEDALTLQRREIAERLVTRLLAGKAEQLQLFKSQRERDDAQWQQRGLETLQKRHPERLVIDARTVDQYRYEAAMYGAGFHPSQFDEITWCENELAGTNTVWFDPLGGWHIRHQPERAGRSNRMRDEVSEELFAQIVPTTFTDSVGGSQMYITSKEDLRAIFEFDQVNLAGCKWLSDDLLYEREN